MNKPLESLTLKQRRCFNAIADHVRLTGSSPTIKELQSLLGYGSPSSIQQGIEILLRKKYLRYHHSRLDTHTSRCLIVNLYPIAPVRGTDDEWVDIPNADFAIVNDIDDPDLARRNGDYLLYKKSGELLGVLRLNKTEKKQ